MAKKAPVPAESKKPTVHTPSVEAQRLAERRRAIALAGWKCATLCGISPYTLVRFETGRQELPRAVRDRLETLLSAFEAIVAKASADLAATTIDDLHRRANASVDASVDAAGDRGELEETGVRHS